MYANLLLKFYKLLYHNADSIGLFVYICAGNSAKYFLNVTFMEKLSFNEVLAIAENFDVDFNNLLVLDGNCHFNDRFGHFVPDDSDYVIQSNKSYDRISAYIKILNEVLSYSPFPF